MKIEGKYVASQNYTYLINKQYSEYKVICNGTRIYYVCVFLPNRNLYNVICILTARKGVPKCIITS